MKILWKFIFKLFPSAGGKYAYVQSQSFFISSLLILTLLNSCGRAGDKELADVTGANEIVGSNQSAQSSIGLKYLQGNNQEYYAGFVFPEELKVKTFSGKIGLPGFEIRFRELTSTGAQILTPVTKTGSSGIAATQVIPSAYNPGDIIIQAEILSGDTGSFASGFAPIVFNLKSLKAAHHIEYVQGNNQTVTVNQVAPISPTIKVVDANGEMVSNWDVTWTVTSGEGSITNTTKSDEFGFAAVDWTMGTNSLLINQIRVTALTIANPSSITFNATAEAAAPYQILLNGGDTSLTAGDCSSAFEVQLKDQFDNISPTLTDTTINLTETGGGLFYSDSSCTPSNEISSFDITTGNSSATFYYRSTLAGNFEIEAAGTALVSDSQAMTINHAAPNNLVLISGNSQTTTVDSYLPVAPTVQVVDVYNNPIPNATVNFTINSGGGTIDTITTLTDTSGYASTAFKLGSVVGTNTMTASNLALPGAPNSITFTETAIADSPTRMEISGLATITAGDCPSAYTVTLYDQFSNVALATSNINLSLTGEAFGNFYSEASCSGGNEITNVTISNNTSSATFYYRNTKAQIVNFAIDDATVLEDDSYAVTVEPAPPYKILLSGSSTLATDECSPQYTIQIKDEFDNFSPVTVNTTINLSGKSNGQFYSDSLCNGGNEIASLTIGVGSYTGQFYFMNSVAESMTFTTDDLGALVSSNLSVATDNGPPIDNGADL